MGARLIILIFLAGGLAVYFAVQPKKQAVGPDREGSDMLVLRADGQVEGDIIKELVSEQPISGSEPKEKPEFRVGVEVDRTHGKSRLILTLTELHGFYADTFDVEIWRKGENVTGPEDSPYSFVMHINNFLRAKSTFRTCLDIVPAELRHVGNEVGTAADWDAAVVKYGRAREVDPEPLPRVSATSKSACE